MNELVNEMEDFTMILIQLQDGFVGTWCCKYM